ncbi:hypothetical protein U1Q18_014062 [Sarracenia purpurea var. burkii]
MEVEDVQEAIDSEGIQGVKAAFLGSPPSSLSVCCWGLHLEIGGVLLLGLFPCPSLPFMLCFCFPCVGFPLAFCGLCRYLGAAVKCFVVCLFLWRGNIVIAVCEMYVSWGREEWVRAALALACSCCFASWASCKLWAVHHVGAYILWAGLLADHGLCSRQWHISCTPYQQPPAILKAQALSLTLFGFVVV